MEKPGGRRPTENSSLLGACLKDHAALGSGVGGALGDAAPAVVTVDLPSTKPLYVPV
eukprot:gene19186-10282_t